MPEMNGFEVAETLSKDPRTARIPILVVTAMEITSDERARLNGYVTKIVEKRDFDAHRFAAEVHRATCLRPSVA
jgi:CheY-like chemotaxis protein